MKRLRHLFLALFLVPGMLVGVSANAWSAEYETITPPQPTANPDKVEVIEVFWYRCPHCYRLQPTMERWLKTKPDNVDFIRMPAILAGNWALHARAYYTAEVLGIVDKIHRPLFDAIHAERRDLDSEEALQKFFGEFGVDAATFQKTWRSFAVETKVRRARIMTQRYGITGTPTIVIDGKYRTDGTMAGNYANMMRVVDELIAKETKLKAEAKKNAS